MPKFLNNLDLAKNQLQNALVHKLSAAPGSPLEGQIYYNTTDGAMFLRDAVSFKKMLLSGQVVNADIASGAAIAYSKLALTDSIQTGDLKDNSVTADKIAADAVGSSEIASGAVGTDELASGSVTNAKMANDSVGSDQIIAGSVGNSELASDAVTADKIAADAVGSSEIASGAVGTDELAADSVTQAKMATDSVGSDEIIAGSVGNSELASDAVTADKIAADAVGSSEIASGAVGTDELASDAVTQAKMATDSVGSDEIISGAVGTDELASDAVTQAKMATDSVGSDEIIAGAVGTEELADNSVTSDKMAAGLDAIAAANASAGDITASNQKITDLADGTNASDAATYGQLVAVANGITDWKASVRAISLGNLSLSGLETVDGVSLQAGDRVLLNGQSNATENGIYVVAEGAWLRSDDANTDAYVTAGLAVMVTEGTDYDNTIWLLATNDQVTLGTTELSFVQLPSLRDLVAGDGLTLTGNTLDIGGTADRIDVNADSIDISSTYAGQESIDTLGTVTTGTWEADIVDVTYGGTGASDAAGAKTNLGFMTRYAASVGDGLSAELVVTHDLGTRDVMVQVFDSASYEQVFPDVEHSTNSAITLKFAEAPAAGAYRVVVIG